MSGSWNRMYGTGIECQGLEGTGIEYKGPAKDWNRMEGMDWEETGREYWKGMYGTGIECHGTGIECQGLE